MSYYLDASEVGYGTKSFTKDFTATGRKIELVLNGKRMELNDLANTIVGDGSFLLSDIPGLSAELQELLTGTALARTPKLVYNGEGDKADLHIYGEQGLNEGDSTVGDDGGDYTVPFNTTSRFVFEPNDVALAYGLPFRAGRKWDLTQTLSAAVGTVPDAVYNCLFDQGRFSEPNDITCLELIHFWETAAIDQQLRGPIQDMMRANTEMSEWMTRYLRGQTSYRFWIPHVSVIRRFRTMPQLEGGSIQFSKPGAIAYRGQDGGPPMWTNAPGWADWGDADTPSSYYNYYASGPQIDFNGDFYSCEEQWQGFLDYDSDLYDNPAP